MISDSKKIEILEEELKEKDKRIDELTAENDELRAVIDSYDGVENSMDELREASRRIFTYNGNYK